MWEAVVGTRCSRRRAAHLATAASAMVLAAGVLGCGDDADRPDREPAPVAADAGARTVIDDPPLRGSDDRAAIAEVIDDVQEGLAMGHGASVCFELSEAARLELHGSADRDLRACGEVVEQAIERWRAAGEEPVLSAIEAIQIRGDEALVTLDVPDRGRHRVRVVNNSHWELPMLDLERPPGFSLLAE